MKQLERLTVGMAQTMCVTGDIDSNLLTIETFCSEASQKGVALLLFSEVALTGSLHGLESGRAAHKYATKLPGPETDRLTSVCEDQGLSIVVGTVEIDEHGELFKTAFVITPNGYEGKYRKYQPTPAEREDISPGSETPLFQIHGWTLAIGVCWDLYFPELAQLYALKGADLYVLPSGDNAYPLRDAQHAAEKSEFNRAGFRKVGPARACDNSMYVFIPVDANSAGGSVAFDPTGEQIAFGRTGEELIPVELRLDLLTETRPGVVPYWRSDVFSQLAERTCLRSW